MTATRDRRSDPEQASQVPWDERPIVTDRRGLPWWAAVLFAFGLTALAAVVDMQLQDKLGLLFKGCYFVGSVVGICAVQRKSLFGPMVQPPLILGITVPVVVLFASGLPESSDTLATALAIGTPLINGFPTMAITTAVTVLIGVARFYRERDPDRPIKPATKAKEASGGKSEAVAGKPRRTGQQQARGKRPEGAETGREGTGPAAGRQPSSDRRRRPDGARRAGGPREKGREASGPMAGADGPRQQGRRRGPGDPQRGGAGEKRPDGPPAKRPRRPAGQDEPPPGRRKPPPPDQSGRRNPPRDQPGRDQGARERGQRDQSRRDRRPPPRRRPWDES